MGFNFFRNVQTSEAINQKIEEGKHKRMGVRDKVSSGKAEAIFGVFAGAKNLSSEERKPKLQFGGGRKLTNICRLRKNFREKKAKH